MNRYKGLYNNIINQKLYEKYCNSQEILMKFLNDSTKKGVIRYKDWNSYDEDNECLKRIYKLGEYPSEIALLFEYLKFHGDIA